MKLLWLLSELPFVVALTFAGGIASYVMWEQGGWANQALAAFGFIAVMAASARALFILWGEA